MEFREVLKKLDKMMKQPLPGRQGQISMSPKPIDETRFSENKPLAPRKGAVLMLFYPNENQALIPFIKRPSYDGAHGGQIAFPGGKWEEDDGDLSRTAIRETEEEIGVESDKINLLGRLSDLYIPPSNFLVSPFIGFVDKKPIFKPDPFEVDQIISCPIELLTDLKIRKEGEITGQSKIKLKAPYFDIENQMVWGATAMMLGEFMFLWENY